MLNIAIATSTRADWGLLRPLADALRRINDVHIHIIATNMHLNADFGMTVSEIESDGFSIAAGIPMHMADTSAHAAVKGASECMSGMADAFRNLKPDAVIILGDRFEMLATAMAATIMRIPIIHIAGGEISEGAFDDSIRHAITKLSSLHLTATEPYRQRVIQMGEHPDTVVNTGAIGVYNLINEKPIALTDLESDLGITINRNTLLVTLHPATMDNTPTSESCRAMLDALDEFPESTIIFTYPNNDPDGKIIIELIEEYASQHQMRAVAIPSLGWKRYLSALHYVGAVVGNSSSGIVEVPSMGIPTVDIGIRQKGRLCAESVIHCKPTRESIADAIRQALSPDFREKAAKAVNPYGDTHTLDKMLSAILNADFSKPATKTFFNLSDFGNNIS